MSFIYNENGERINPATEENQDDIIKNQDAMIGSLLGLETVLSSAPVTPSNNPISVTTSETTLATTAIGSAYYLSLDLDNSATSIAALSDLKIYIRTNALASWRQVELDNDAYVMDYTVGIATLAIGAGGIIRMDVRGLESVKITATVAADTANITILGGKS